MIRYSDTIDGVRSDQLKGFFVGWPNPPSPGRHLDILKRSSHVVLAIDDKSNRVVGFINAISDGIISAYLPLLEVLPEYQHRGIGSELIARMLRQLKGLYMIDLVCDDKLRPYYEKLGMRAAVGMMIRNFDRQSGV
jgi:ribosomal protein S18 acetylase RimI-like enzyme